MVKFLYVIVVDLSRWEVERLGEKRAKNNVLRLSAGRQALHTCMAREKKDLDFRLCMETSSIVTVTCS